MCLGQVQDRGGRNPLLNLKTLRQEATVVNKLALTISSTKLMPNCIVPWDPNRFVDMLILKAVEAISGEYCHHSNTALIFKDIGLMGQDLSAGIGQQVETV